MKNSLFTASFILFTLILSMPFVAFSFPGGGATVLPAGHGAGNPSMGHGVAGGESGTDGTITVTAMKEGKPVEGVTVRLVKFERMDKSMAGEVVTGPDGIARFTDLTYGGVFSYRVEYAYNGVEFPPRTMIIGVKDFVFEARVAMTTDPSVLTVARRDLIISGHQLDGKNLIRVVDNYTLSNGSDNLFHSGDEPASFLIGSVPAGATEVYFWDGRQKRDRIEGNEIRVPIKTFMPNSSASTGVTYFLEFAEGRSELDAELSVPVKGFSLISSSSEELLIESDRTEPKTNAGSKHNFEMVVTEPTTGQAIPIRITFLKESQAGLMDPHGAEASAGVDEHEGHAHNKKTPSEEGGDGTLIFGLVTAGFFVIIGLVVLKLKLSRGTGDTR